MNLDEAGFQSLLVEDSPPLINIGMGEDVTVRELPETVARVLGFSGQLAFDTTKPDGTPRKLMEVSRLHSLGWHHTTGLEQGSVSLGMQSEILSKRALFGMLLVEIFDPLG